MIVAQSKTDFSQSECCSFGLITRRAWVSWFLWQPKVRWPGYVLPSCSCGINRLFVNRMAKHSLSSSQSMRQLGKRSKVKGNKSFWACSFVESGCLSDWGLGNISHTGLLPKNYWELAQAGFYYKVLSLTLFLSESCHLKFIKMQGIFKK